jgi:hypothetical protein
MEVVVTLTVMVRFLEQILHLHQGARRAQTVFLIPVEIWRLLPLKAFHHCHKIQVTEVPLDLFASFLLPKALVTNPI